MVGAGRGTAGHPVRGAPGGCLDVRYGHRGPRTKLCHHNRLPFGAKHAEELDNLTTTLVSLTFPPIPEQTAMMRRLRAASTALLPLLLALSFGAAGARGLHAEPAGAQQPAAYTYLVFGPSERLLPLPAGVEILGPSGAATLVRGPAPAVEEFALRGLSLVRRSASATTPGPGPAARRQPPPRPPAPSFNPRIAEIVLSMSTAEVTATIQRLQDFRTRYSTTDSCRAAAEYLRSRFLGFGIPAVFDLFTINGQPVYNVIAEKEGTVRPDEIYIICGHYDSISGQPQTDAPGADDNASGTAAVVEAARVLADIDLAATVRFIAFGGEEQGLVGSEHYVTHTVIPNNEDLRGVLNLDMVGYVHPDFPEWDANWYADILVSETLGDYVAEHVMMYTTCTLHLIPTTGPQYGSDHYHFAENGYPAVMDIDAQLWGAPDWNPYYHSPQDRIETLDLAYATEMARGAVAALADLAGVEPGTSVVDPGPGASLPALAVAPNPFWNEVAFDVGPRPVRLTVVNVSGRVVTELAGSGRIVWSGIDAGGQAVAPGTYFYRLDGADGATGPVTGRMVRTR